MTRQDEHKWRFLNDLISKVDFWDTVLKTRFKIWADQLMCGDLEDHNWDQAKRHGRRIGYSWANHQKRYKEFDLPLTTPHILRYPKLKLV